jgi:MFS family permease
MDATSTEGGVRRLLSHPPFLFYISARIFSQFAYQIAAVAMQWQIYELTNSPVYLGLAGLVQFLPTLVLLFVGGVVADRYDRNRILQVCQAMQCITAIGLLCGSLAGWLNVYHLFAALALFGVARSFESPASAALLTGVVPESMVQRGTALAFGSSQMATIGGPALGGVFFLLSPSAPYLAMAVFWLLGFILNGFIKLNRSIEAKPAAKLSDFLAGIVFVRKSPAILGTISLDLFVVLLGGATALLPIYARDILLADSATLGVLRMSPAIGALLMTIYLTRHPVTSKVGLRMFQAVIVFGIATLVFALSKWIWLSVLSLVILGAADVVSVVIRLSLVQLATPNDMRGRVGAVNFLFINASNQLGEFRAGLTAHWFGTVPSAVIGGVGSILVSLLWMRLFPSLRKYERLE